MTRSLVLSMALMVMGMSWSAAADEPLTKVPDRATLEKTFEQTMSGATLVGHFTTTGKEDKTLKEEKYTISKVSKVKDDLWLFNVRIQYGNHDATLPLTLEVKWSGDTPVITLTDFAVPGFGSFTCRVLVYRDQYAGTWSASDHGGHLFGRIVKEKPAESK